MEQTKICSKCGKELQLECFTKHPECKNGIRSSCKECDRKYRQENSERIKKYMKQYQCDNSDELKEKSKIYQKNNKEKLDESKKKYYNANKEQLKQYKHEYYQNNKERLTEINRNYAINNRDKTNGYKIKYYENNKEKVLKIHRQYYKNNKEKLAELRKQYRENNKELIRERRIKYCSAQSYKEKHKIYTHNRKALKNSLEKNFKISDWELCKSKFNNMCAYCGNEKELTQEHFIPLTKGGEYTVNNIIPVCKECNSSKSNKNFFEWYPKQEFYLKTREKNILNYLNYKNNNQQLALII